MTLCSLNAAIKFPKLPAVISSAAAPQHSFLEPNMLIYLPVRDDGAHLQPQGATLALSLTDFLSGCLSPYVSERKVIGGFGLEESQLICL